ncbi:MAG: hypothetical protein WBC89_01540 [Dehalococcoidia bacterium]|jgi:membrane protein implicated in regulation of membrane protease activity
MRVLGAFLLVCGFVVAIGYLLYWFFSAVAESIPMPLKVAIVAAAIGLLLLFISIGRERYKASKKEEFKEVER